jgi:hypothetical protein
MTTVIYHSGDFDGQFCGEIARKFLGDKDVNYLGWNFGDPPLPIPGAEVDSVYVMDLPLDAPFGVKMPLGLTGVVKNGVNGLVWIDHHGSSIASHPTDIPGYRIDGVAACRLAWQWFTGKTEFAGTWELPAKQSFIDRKVSEPLAVRLAGEYDVRDKRDERADVFQYGLRASVNVLFDSLLCGGNENTYLNTIIDRGNAAQVYARTVDASNMKASFLMPWEGLTFLCLNGRGNSLTFASRDIAETGHQALLMFYFNGGAWVVSLYHARHRTDLDLSKIAVAHGGGGHRGACGFTSNGFPFPVGGAS